LAEEAVSNVDHNEIKQQTTPRGQHLDKRGAAVLRPYGENTQNQKEMADGR
jgi:hypothetical protein